MGCESSKDGSALPPPPKQPPPARKWQPPKEAPIPPPGLCVPDDEPPKSTLRIKGIFEGRTYSVELSNHATVLDLKKMFQANINRPPKKQRLVFFGRTLTDTERLFESGLRSNKTLLITPTGG